MRNAYKNKYTTNEFQLSLIGFLTQNKARNATNTSSATLDLSINQEKIFMLDTNCN
jgi:hypothetical protein